MSNSIKTYVDHSREQVIWKNKPSGESKDILNIQMAGVTFPDKNYAMHRTRKTPKEFEKLYVIEYVVSGVGYIDSEGISTRVGAGDVYIIHRRTLHTYYADKQQPFTKKWLNVSGSFINAMEDVFFSDGPFTVVSVGDKAERIMDSIHATLAGAETQTAELVADIMKKLLDLFILMDQKRKSDRGSMSVFEQICAYVDENICDDLNVARIAERFFISSSTLYRIFRAQAGMSPKEYVVWRKVEVAKRMIGAGGITFNNIAADLGFYDSHHFFKTFRAVTGMSPSEYRKQLNEEEDLLFF